MDLFSNHQRLFTTVLVFFIALSIPVGILPALYNQENNKPLPEAELLEGDVLAGKKIFIENGCVACHTQQVRNVAMDKVWGDRPGVAADYAIHERTSWWMNSATLMGTERTGPDLSNIGTRLPSEDWHLIHLYNPRAVVEESIMPAYSWLFEHKEATTCEDNTVNVPAEFVREPGMKVVASAEALQLVAYLKSLKQASLTGHSRETKFLYKEEASNHEHAHGEEHDHEKQDVAINPEGAKLYAKNCQACHQSNGEGLQGAFPPLKGSSIVNDENPEILISIIMKGYNANEAFGEMPAVGKLNSLSAGEITAIINHERSSWGNNARIISVDETEKILQFIQNENNQ